MRVNRGEYGAAPECKGDPRENRRAAVSSGATPRRRQSNPVYLGGRQALYNRALFEVWRQNAKGGGKKEDARENPPTKASSGTCENPGVTPLEIDPGSSRWKASSLTTTPPRPRRLEYSLHLNLLSHRNVARAVPNCVVLDDRIAPKRLHKLFHGSRDTSAERLVETALLPQKGRKELLEQREKRKDEGNWSVPTKIVKKRLSRFRRANIAYAHVGNRTRIASMKGLHASRTAIAATDCDFMVPLTLQCKGGGNGRSRENPTTSGMIPTCENPRETPKVSIPVRLAGRRSLVPKSEKNISEAKDRRHESPKTMGLSEAISTSRNAKLRFIIRPLETSPYPHVAADLPPFYWVVFVGRATSFSWATNSPFPPPPGGVFSCPSAWLLWPELAGGTLIDRRWGTRDRSPAEGRNMLSLLLVPYAQGMVEAADHGGHNILFHAMHPFSVRPRGCSSKCCLLNSLRPPFQIAECGRLLVDQVHLDAGTCQFPVAAVLSCANVCGGLTGHRTRYLWLYTRAAALTLPLASSYTNTMSVIFEFVHSVAGCAAQRRRRGKLHVPEVGKGVPAVTCNIVHHTTNMCCSLGQYVFPTHQAMALLPLYPSFAIYTVTGPTIAFAWSDFGKPKSGCSEQESNPDPPECESMFLTVAGVDLVLTPTATIVPAPGNTPPTPETNVPFGTVVTWAALGSSRVGIAPDNAASLRVFSGISRFPLPCIPVPLHTHLFTLIGPRDLDIKSHPDLFPSISLQSTSFDAFKDSQSPEGPVVTKHGPGITAGNTANEVFIVETLYQEDFQRWGRAVRRHTTSRQPSEGPVVTKHGPGITAGNTANEVFVVETLYQEDFQRWGRAVRRHTTSRQPSEGPVVTKHGPGITAGNTANEVFIVETLYQEDFQRWGRAVRRHTTSRQPSEGPVVTKHGPGITAGNTVNEVFIVETLYQEDFQRWGRAVRRHTTSRQPSPMSRASRTKYSLRETVPTDYRRNEYKVVTIDPSNISDPTVQHVTESVLVTEPGHERNDDIISVSNLKGSMLAQETRLVASMAAQGANMTELTETLQQLKAEFKTGIQSRLSEVTTAPKEELRREVCDEVLRATNRLQESITLNSSHMDSLSDNVMKRTDLEQAA
ncbi:hypothetical protein PR048_017138 [Dryococelus australis]|uniref:Uncharacterized protein n=1 Tax=Dryococelus australis TaxID=614101 RepID=A0ABQ9H8P0_9NEOP|nr:hypothetical protein PR048_017138 [Dryococelus australis]